MQLIFERYLGRERERENKSYIVPFLCKVREAEKPANQRRQVNVLMFDDRRYVANRGKVTVGAATRLSRMV